MTYGGSINYRALTFVGKNKTKIALHTAFDGLTGTDSAGNAYTFTGHGNATVEIPNGGTLHGVGVAKITAVGSGPDAGEHIRFKAAIAIVGGVLSVTFDSLKITCV